MRIPNERFCNKLIDLHRLHVKINHIRSKIVNPELDQKALAPQRLDNLRALIRDDGLNRVGDLCHRLKVSAATVRRDLDLLERSGVIRRVHGGAVSMENRLDESLFEDKTSQAVREKRCIAEAALKFIEPGDTIYLDGGSTVLEGRGSADVGEVVEVSHGSHPSGIGQDVAEPPASDAKSF